MLKHMLTVIGVLVLLTAIVSGAVPQKINYQGMLLNSAGLPLDTTVDFTFTIYDAATVGNSKWTETHSSVVVVGGQLSVLLGSVIPIDDTVFNTVPRYLGISLGNSPELTPRAELVAVPTALRVGTIDGATGGDIYGNVTIHSTLQVGDLVGDVGIILATDGSDTTINLDGPTGDVTANGKGTIGPGHTNDGNFAFVAGEDNNATATAAHAFIAGKLNTITSGNSTIGGGAWNRADGETSTVGGGGSNKALGPVTTIAGGGANEADGTNSSIGGGFTNRTWDHYSTVGGGRENEAGFDNGNTGDQTGATVSGGLDNRATSEYSTVGGGNGNRAADFATTVSGGQENSAQDDYATVGGGLANIAGGLGSTIGGGLGSIANGPDATIAGGNSNSATGAAATVPGGRQNSAEGDFSFAAGRQATVRAGDNGTFVWADNSGGAFQSTGQNQFLIRATGGVGIGTTAPDPSSQLDVAGRTRTDKLIVDENVGIGITPDDAFLTYIYDNFSGSSQRMGVFARLISSGTGTVTGLYGSVETTGAGAPSQSLGVVGKVQSDGGYRIGVTGYASSKTFGLTTGQTYGVYGSAFFGQQAYGVYGIASGATTNWAGYFVGDLNATGNIYGASKSFRIDHPLYPEEKFLIHTSVESPDMMNVYNGNAVFDINGEATVILPDYFEALNRDFRYQLTCIGGYAPVYIADKIQGNTFKIAGGESGLEVSWQVTGVRQDAYAKANRNKVEVNKLPAERGKYIHPEAFGLSASMGIDAEQIKNSPLKDQN